MNNKPDKRETRVLVFMPTGRDAELVCATLERAGISAHGCDGEEALVREIDNGAGTVLIAEEALQGGAIGRLVEAVDRQPIWSDLPVILFSSSSRNAESLLSSLGSRFNVTVVERPIRVTMLLSAVRGALRARQRQYQTRDLLAKLEEADKQKDLFLATLSHELRTPLNSILGWIQILRGRNVSREEELHALEVIERNAKTQAEMISDILFVSRVITGKLELKREPLDLVLLIKSAIDIIRPSAEAKSIHLTAEVDEKASVLIEGDKERLLQVLLNLLTNAIKFTPERGHIGIDLSVDGGNAVIEVNDSGQGIDPKFLPFLFEKFRQADSTYTRSVGGLGLGLAIVRHLVELHGGRVSGQSEGLGKGSTFRIALPVALAADHHVPRPEGMFAAANGSSAQLNKIRVLLVEDDADSREMLATVLSHFGIETRSVESASEAIPELRSYRPDLLISDVGLPGEDGYDLIRKIRALPKAEGGDVPAIALTGYVSLQDRALALAAGYQEHLPKPVDTDDLVERISLLVQPRSHQR